MKKTKIYSLLALALGVLGFTACADDNDWNPVIDNAPTKFVLNTPAVSDQYVELSAENTVNLTWSQPDYGFPAIATYKVQVGVEDEQGNIKWEQDKDGKDKYLDETYTKCSADISGEALAQAICNIDGFTSKDNYVDMGFRKIAMRVYSSILDGQNRELDKTAITSNTVTFNHMKAYAAIREKAYIYLIGAPSGWNEPSEANAEALKPYRIYETEIGTNIFQGSFEVPAGQFQMRFYSALTGWGTNDASSSIGANENDGDNLSITLTNNVFSGDATVPGKGNWQLDSWQGGYVTITVNMNSKKVKFEATGSGPAKLPTGQIYLIGAPSGWVEPIQDNAEKLEDYVLNEYDDNGIYSATFDIAAGNFMFRFYKALTGWDAGDSMGAAADDSNVDITLTDKVYSGTAVAGKGNWNIADWAGGKVKIEYDSNTGKVTFTAE